VVEYLSSKCKTLSLNQEKQSKRKKPHISVKGPISLIYKIPTNHLKTNDPIKKYKFFFKFTGKRTH
jgi:hypothetical protein